MSDCTDSHSRKFLHRLSAPQDPFCINGHEEDDARSPILANEEEEDNAAEAEIKVKTSNENSLSAAARCLALEQAYVHEVYAQIARECGACSPVRSHIKEFVFEEFTFGSILLDVGCGDGKYLHINAGVYTVGLERCPDWFARDEDEGLEGCYYPSVPSFGDYLLGDVMQIPFRDDFIDGVLCCGVLHHISTTERRIRALTQLSRLLKTGGKLLITVWAFEGRELESQDVLIKWTNGLMNSKGRESGNQLNGRGVRFRSPGHAVCSSSCSCTQMSDEDTGSSSSCSTTTTTYVNRRAAYESCNSPTSEFGTCYSFVKKALLKFNLSPASFYYSTTGHHHHHNNINQRRSSRSSTAKNSSIDAEDIPVELLSSNIESDSTTDFIATQEEQNMYHDSSQASPHKQEDQGSLHNNNNNNNHHHSSRKNSLLESGLKLISGIDSPSKSSLKESYGSLVSLVRDRIWSKVKVTHEVKDIESKASSIGKSLRHRFSLPVVVTDVRKFSLSRHFNSNSSDSDPYHHHHQLHTIFGSSDKVDCPEDKVCSHSIFKKAVMTRHPRIDEVDSRQESLDLTERTEEESIEKDDEVPHLSLPKVNTNNNNSNNTFTTTASCKKRMFGGKNSLQKSLSSDSLDSKHSRQQSLNTESTTSKTTTTTNSISCSTNCSLGSRMMVAYYSMPELRALQETSPEEESCGVRGRRSRPRITDLHPITFLEEVEEVSLPRSKEVKRESSQDTEAAVDEMENMFHSIEIINSKCSSSQSNYSDMMQFPRSNLKDRMRLTLPSTKFYLQPAPHQEESDALLTSNVAAFSESEGENEDTKKTQRSSSVEYKAKISPSYRQNLRRFSASPSLLVPKTFVHFFQEEHLHETHPSVDSEESFVTIIPANRSCRGSLAIDESEGSFLDDVMLEVDPSMLPSPDEIAFGESLSAVNLKVPAPSRATGILSNASSPGQAADSPSQVITSNVPTTNSSISPSSVSGASTPDPTPGNLHRYFHLFRCGELEDLITNNVEQLHVLRSYYSEHATSWCVVCEKRQV